MYTFFASIHARPEEVQTGKRIALAGDEYETLEVPAALRGQPFERDFETTLDALGAWERMFVEPDGSFLWVSSHAEAPWQVDGNLYDRDELLLFVDVKGSCPRERFDQLLEVLGWPATPLMFQLTQAAVYLAESEFRRYVSPSERPNKSP